MRWVLAWILSAGLAAAEGEPAGDFDYYVMALSWSASWCALEGDARGDPQCDDGRGKGFVLHGLWPQYEDGWPSYCRTGARDPSRGDTAAVADIFGGAGAAFYQWKKHGRCSGLTSDDYFDLARRAYGSVAFPAVFDRLSRDLTLPAAVVEDAFLEANPGMSRDQITITCDEGRIAEVRICLTTDLDPRRCSDDVIRDCRMKDALMEAVR